MDEQYQNGGFPGRPVEQTGDPFAHWKPQGRESGMSPQGPQAPGMGPQNPGMVSQAPGMGPQNPGMTPQAPVMASEGTTDELSGKDPDRMSGSAPQAAHQSFAQQWGIPNDIFQPADSYDPYAGRPKWEQERTDPREKTQEAKKKKGHGPVIAICSVGVVVVGLLICYFLGIFTPRNGTYVWDDYAVYNTTLKLELKGDEGVLTADYNGKTSETKVDVDFDGSKVVFSAHGKYIEGTYDSKRGTISVPDDSLLGFEIVLKKSN